MKPKIRRIINRADMRNRLQSKGQSGLGNTAFGAFLIFCQNFSQLEFRQKTFVTLTAGHEPMRGGMSSLVASSGFCHPTFKKKESTTKSKFQLALTKIFANLFFFISVPVLIKLINLIKKTIICPPLYSQQIFWKRVFLFAFPSK